MAGDCAMQHVRSAVVRRPFESGNGVDLGAIYQAIVAIASDVRELRREIAAKADRNDVAELRQDVAGLRQAVDDYHNAVIGHGVLIGEFG